MGSGNLSKKAYAAPKLVVYGDLKTLVKNATIVANPEDKGKKSECNSGSDPKSCFDLPA
jgi:hypothetical protein